jgi:hypothetical protein
VVKEKIMIVIRTTGVKDVEESTAAVFIISETVDEYQVCRTLSDESIQTIKKSDIPDDGRIVYFWSHYGFGLVPAPDYDSSRDSAAFYIHKYGCYEGPVITVARQGDKSVLVCGAACHAKTEFVIRQVPGPSIDLVEEFIPGFSSSSRALKSRAKMELIKQINPLDSLAALENQVDLLTAVIICLMSGDPVPPWVNDFVKTMQQNSSFMGRTPEQVVAMVNDEKSKIRGLQKEYFNGQIQNSLPRR